MAIRSWRSLQWFVPALASATLLSLPIVAGAGHRVTNSSRDRAAVGRLISVEVRVDGRWVPLHRAAGLWDRHYFQAERGESYALRIRNRADRRIGVLISVDGLNVVSGERSGLSPHEPMYVLDPHETSTIRGWRTSLEQVREFVFVDEQRSYASRTGQANGDMGWIRVLAFEERRPIAWRRGYDDDRLGENRRDREDEPHAGAQPQEKSAPAPSAGKGSSDAPQTLEGYTQREESYPGTGWGDRRRDRVRETWFEPMPAAVDRIVLRYEYEAGLVALGILPNGDRLADRDQGEWRFALPPRW
jgi:hypothetical protein